MKQHRLLATAAALALATWGVGCAHVKTVEGLDAKVREVPGGYVTGRVAALGPVTVLDNKDFVYSIGLDEGGTRAAFTHLTGKTFNLGLWTLGPPAAPIADVATNEYQYDVEAVAFSPDGKWVATAGRDAAVRLYSAADGKLVAETFAEEPLVSLAFLKDGSQLIAGSARGLLTVFSAPKLAWTSDLRVHAGEVRAVATTADGKIVSGGWDKSIAVLETTQAPLRTDEVRLVIGAQKNTRVVRAGLDGWVGAFAFDAVQPHVIVSEKLAKQAGIETSLLTETVLVGGYPARVAKNRTIQLKYLELSGVDVAVCEPCLPPGVQGVLGAPVLGRFDFRVDEGSGELVLSAKEKSDPSNLPTVLTLREVKRHRFDSYVNDLSVDRAGKRLGVAFSAEKAERNREVYEREKRGEDAPINAGDFAAIVDVESGAVVKRWTPHLGVVATAAISPDGQTLASGGWDKKLFVVHESEEKPVLTDRFGWSVRRVRFSEDGRLLAVGAWTPQNAVGSQESDPSAVVYRLGYSTAEVVASDAVR